MAEAVWPQWKAYFGAEPPKDRLPLELDVRMDREGFLHAVHKVGVLGTLPAAGGYYDPRSRVSFLYRQPHASSTRLLVLHELTHQYQYKALQDDVPDRSPMWHREGLAERFGYHRRLGEKVEIGAYDIVAIDDRPTECAKRVADGKFDPWAVGTGKATTADYTDALALVETCLSTKDEVDPRRLPPVREGDLQGRERGLEVRARLRREARAARGGREGGLGALPAHLARRLRRLGREGRRHRRPRHAVVVPRPPRRADGLGDRSIEAKIGLGKDTVAGGLAVGAKAPEDLIGLVLRREGRVILTVRRRGRVDRPRRLRAARRAAAAARPRAPHRARARAPGGRRRRPRPPRGRHGRRPRVRRLRRARRPLRRERRGHVRGASASGRSDVPFGKDASWE